MVSWEVMTSSTASSATVRYGVIGTGMMGREHIADLVALDGVEVTAIADTNADSLDAGSAASQHVAEPFKSHRDLLESGLCDAVVVATPDHTHVDVLADTLATDIHVLVEKPLCTTVADCQRIIALDERRQGVAVTWVGLEYRYMPAIAELVRRVHGGEVGRTRMVAMREHRFPFLHKVDQWNRLSENTGGTLVEKACHFFDLMNLILRERPDRVMASGGQDVNHLDEVVDGRPADMLDNAYVIVDYASGARAMLDLCMFAEATHNQEEISVAGSDGKIEALIPENLVRLGRRGEHWIGAVESMTIDDSSIAHRGLHGGSSYLEHVRFLDSIRSGTRPDATLHDGLWSVAMGVAAHRSIELGRPVHMKEVLA
ncbi:MAG: Gfo/Idh/MocA family oxidoreductase [Ilumatobacteraceae bacterium]